MIYGRIATPFSRKSLIFNVTENMLFRFKQVVHTHIALTKCYKKPGNIIFLEKFARDLLVHILQTHSQSKKSHNLELSIFGSWFMEFLARGGSWWLVMACGN